MTTHLQGNATHRFGRRISMTSGTRQPYRRRKDDKKTVLHWGQLKLMLTEIEFLTLARDQKIHNNIIVYAGAAPAIHMKHLSDMFPEFTFHLYDPTSFQIKATKRIKLFNQLFTEETANGYAGKKVLFISDIRRKPADEKTVDEDMIMQRKWVEIIKPVFWMLKFRLPYSKHGKYNYLKGDIYKQAFVGASSSETRLIGSTIESKNYDTEAYEQLMFAHNISRTKFHVSPLGRTTLESHDVCNCFDCVSFVRLIESYLKSKKKDAVLAEIHTVRSACGPGTILSRTKEYWKKLNSMNIKSGDDD